MKALLPENTLYLVDVSSFIFRAFYAIRALKSAKGEPTNAVYGVASMLSKLLEEHKPKYISIVYDSKEPSFRKEIFPEYKSNRSAPPEDLIPQFDRIETLIRLLKIPSVRQSGIEADDLIACLTKRWIEASPDHEVVVVTGDKDLLQLVEPRVKALDTMKNAWYSPAEVEVKMGVRPDQVRDFLALVGDTSDFIPGVPSIGPKSAQDLLKEFGTLEAVLAAAKAGKIAGKKGQVLVEHEKEALLSQELATLKTDLDLDYSPKSLLSPYTDGIIRGGSDLRDFLNTLSLHTLEKKWVASSPEFDFSGGQTVAGGGTGVVASGALGAAGSSDSTHLPFFTILDLDAWRDLVAEVKAAKFFAFDSETTSLNPRLAKLVGVSICVTEEKSFYIPVGHSTGEVSLSWEQIREDFAELCRDPEIVKVAHNYKFDRSIFWEQGIRDWSTVYDTMIGDYLIHPEFKHSLAVCADRWLSYPMQSYEDVTKSEAGQITFDQVPIAAATRYSAEDAWVTQRIWNKIEPLLVEKNLSLVLQKIDTPLIPVLGDMEREGISIDEEYLENLREQFQRELQELDEAIHKYTKEPINLNSPKQMAHLLFEELKLPTQGKTKTGFSTDASVLDKLSSIHPVPRLILEHREISKLLGTYIEPLPRLKDPVTGRIHTHFHQTVAATGRLSSSDPNLQNIPIRTERGRKIRRAFIPRSGWTLLSADYSQIELRILAEMSQDEDLVRSFKQKEDIHARTASEIFEVPLDQVTVQQRGSAKAINFGLMYGKTAFGLAEELRISRSEAKDMIDRYFTRYRGVKQTLDGLIESARKHQAVRTMLGRSRNLPDILSKNGAVRSNAERMAMNSPIQGTAADLMKLAMIRVQRRLLQEKVQSKLLVQVHDELVLECPAQELRAMADLVRYEMEHAFEGVIEFGTPLDVDVSVGENWYDLRDLSG